MFFFINNVFADVDKIVFISEPQTIVAGVSSERYQIQLQNSSGVLEVAPDTTYFTLPVELGDFSSQKDGVPFTASTSVYIATGSSNKYFYFKSSNIGEYTMLISARNKSNTKRWETDQVVKVIDSIIIPPIIIDPVATSTATTTTDVVATSTATTTIITKIVNHTVYISTHSDSEDISNYVEEELFKISAGRERLTYVGTPLIFTAKNNKNNKNADFAWSFGDISEGKGSEVTHTYKKAGEYIVVLNGDYNNSKAVSRASIKVFEPKIILSFTLDDLEIKNSGENEINIGGWKIKNQNGVFIIPNDTIISSKNNIVIPSKDIPLLFPSNSLVIVEDQSLNIVASTQVSSGPFTLSEEDKNKIILENTEEVEKILGMKVVDAEKLVLDHRTKTSNVSLKSKISSIKTSSFLPTEILSNNKNNSIDEVKQVATVEESINSTSSVGFWEKIINFPVNNIKNISNMFYDL